MQAFSQELEIIIAVTILLLVMTSFIVLFLIIHQRRRRNYVKEKVEMEKLFQQEILKANLEVTEKTLHTISQEIHDNIGQLMSLIKLNLSSMELDKSTKSQEKLENTVDIVAKVINELRDLSKSLNPDFIRKETLTQSLQREVKVIQKVGIFNIDLKIGGTEPILPPEKQLILFRIAQESINNIVKHAQAKEVLCEINFHDDKLSLIIQDDGIGFNAEGSHQHNGTGLQNILHRANLIDADISIQSESGQGTAIKLSLPLEVSGVSI